MKKSQLVALFSLILLGMLAITTYASLDRAVWNAGWQLVSDRWFQATLVDAYFGFLTFFVWVAYRETTAAHRLLWLILIMLLGNIAMAIYVLLQLRRWDPDEGVAALLLRGDDRRARASSV